MAKHIVLCRLTATHPISLTILHRMFLLIVFGFLLWQIQGLLNLSWLINAQRSEKKSLCDTYHGKKVRNSLHFQMWPRNWGPYKVSENPLPAELQRGPPSLLHCQTLALRGPWASVLEEGVEGEAGISPQRSVWPEPLTKRRERTAALNPRSAPLCTGRLLFITCYFEHWVFPRWKTNSFVGEV